MTTSSVRGVAGRATVTLPAAQNKVIDGIKVIDDNELINDNEQTHRQNGASDWALGAYGQVFILAPTFSLRLGAEDSLLLKAAIRQEGLAMLLHSELSGKAKLAGFDASVAPGLSEHAHRVWTDENAGGSSRNSEALSMELLSRAFGAILQKTEMQLRYFPSNSSITDMSISVGGVELGVSVTRAAQHQPNHRFCLEDAEGLLRKKLKGVITATQTCYNASWRKQILHVWAASRIIARLLQAAYARLEPALVADTVVLVTLCQGMPEIFDEKAQPAAPRQRVPKGLKDERHLEILRASDPLTANAQR